MIRNARASGSSSASTWTHIASVWDGTTWFNYQNGVLVGSGSYSTPIPVFDMPLTIGVNSGFDGTRFKGEMADVRLWNVALSQARVQEGMYTLTNTTGLVGRWRFDDATGQTANDASGLGNHGRLGTSTSADTRDPSWNSIPASCK